MPESQIIVWSLFRSVGWSISRLHTNDIGRKGERERAVDRERVTHNLSADIIARRDELKQRISLSCLFFLEKALNFVCVCVYLFLNVI